MKEIVRNLRNLMGVLLVVMFGAMLMATSCDKDEPGGGGGGSQDCSCGSIASFDYDAAGYYVYVKNYCSGNYKWFGVNYSDWLYANVGDECCSNSGSSWKNSSTIIPNIPEGREACEKEQTGEYIE